MLGEGTTKGAMSHAGPSCGQPCAARETPRPRTERTDRWWLAPLREGGLLAALTGYATWAALQPTHWYASPYISPLYSPCLAANCGGLTSR